MASIGTISLRGITHDEFQYTFKVKTGTHESDVDADNTTRGGLAGVAAVTVDSGTANQVRLAGDGDMILGRLEVYEDRSDVEGVVVGTVALKGGVKFLIDPNATASSPDETPTMGDFLVGATSSASIKGYVRKASTAEIQAGKANWQVVEVIGSNVAVIAINV